MRKTTFWIYANPSHRMPGEHGEYNFLKVVLLMNIANHRVELICSLEGG